MQGLSLREFSIPCMDFEPVIRRVTSGLFVFKTTLAVVRLMDLNRAGMDIVRAVKRPV